MIRQPVKSSNVQEIGFEDGVIEVLYTNGSVYSAPGTRDLFDDVMRSPSKGTFLRMYLPHLKPVQVRQEKAKATPSPRETLDSFEPDDCCGTHLAGTLLRGDLVGKRRWHCPDCGTPWAALDREALRHWSPESTCEVIRLRG